MSKMKLYSLTDFPDDCSRVCYTPQMLDSMVSQLADLGISRAYFQYYGGLEDEYMWDSDRKEWETMNQTARLMPRMSKEFVNACKKHGLETAGVMRPHEQGHWMAYSPFHGKSRKKEIPNVGGRIIDPTAFLREHPELRIKRRSYDLDPDALNKTVTTIRLYKQNNAKTRIKKENLTLYTSPDNSYYKPYNGDFTFTVKEQTAERDTVIALGSFKEPYGSKVICSEGDRITVIELSGLEITDRYMAVGVHCDGVCSPEERFVNTYVNGIACFDRDGQKISATPGGTNWQTLSGGSYLDEGFHFDDGFGVCKESVLDPDGREGFFAIAKGKNQYNHAALCECEPLVREYWLSCLDRAIDDGYDFIGNRIECHSVMIDEPFAYGYNDCVKELYFERYGKCEEADIDLAKLSHIRGNVYSELFARGAEKVHKMKRKVYTTLNIEMLQDQIPLARQLAYPMNVEWQWERWLRETRPDEINFRMYQCTPTFLLENPKCRRMIEVARSYNVPLTVERCVTPSLAEEYTLLNETGYFDALILYETATIFDATADGVVKIKEDSPVLSLRRLIDSM